MKWWRTEQACFLHLLPFFAFSKFIIVLRLHPLLCGWNVGRIFTLTFIILFIVDEANSMSSVLHKTHLILQNMAYGVCSFKYCILRVWEEEVPVGGIVPSGFIWGGGGFRGRMSSPCGVWIGKCQFRHGWELNTSKSSDSKFGYIIRIISYFILKG